VLGDGLETAYRLALAGAQQLRKNHAVMVRAARPAASRSQAGPSCAAARLWQGRAPWAPGAVWS
jgi:hypothetical protein